MFDKNYRNWFENNKVIVKIRTVCFFKTVCIKHSVAGRCDYISFLPLLLRKGVAIDFLVCKCIRVLVVHVTGTVHLPRPLTLFLASSWIRKSQRCINRSYTSIRQWMDILSTTPHDSSSLVRLPWTRVYWFPFVKIKKVKACGFDQSQ